ncbi:MAG: type II toxin-antitoxin system VapC family toxin [Candidatus Bathyarchaeia archaeon]
MRKFCLGFEKEGRDKHTLKYVLDASVVLKWILPDETYQENSTRLRATFQTGTIQVFAPSFIVQETANALWLAAKQKRIQQTDAQDALDFLQNAELNLHELSWTEASQVLAIACKIEIAVYDAAYLFLSNKMDAQLITADNKLFEKSKGQFDVMHIKNF